MGVKYPQIRIIEHNYRNCEDQLREIISERLKQNSPLTWHDIVTALRSDSIRQHSLASRIEQYLLLQPMECQSPVRRPSDRGYYRSQSPVRGPSDRGHYRCWSPVRGPSDRGHHRSRSPVRGPSDRGHYRSRSPVRGPSDRGHHRSRLPVRGPSDRGHYRSQSPVRGPSDRGHYRSQSPVRGPSDRGHYRSQSPVREPSDRGHYRSQSPVRGPSDRGHYRSRLPVRGSSDRGHYRSQSPVREPSDRGHYRSQSPVREPSDRGHYRSQSPVRGPSDREHYRSQSPVREPSDRGHYRSQSPVRGPSDREHYRSQSPVRGPSDRGHYRSQSPVRGPSDRGHYRSRLSHPQQMYQAPHPQQMYQGPHPSVPHPYPIPSHMSAPTRPLQVRTVGGQLESQSYMSHSQPQTSHTQSQRNSSMESCPGHNPPYSWQPLDRGTGNTPHMCFPHQMPQYQTAHPLQVGGQWDSQLYMSHGTIHTRSQRRQSDSSGLGSSPPPAKRPHFEPHPHHVRPNTEPLSTYHQSQTSSSGLGSLPTKTTGVKSPMDQYIDYVKDTYRQSVIEKDPSVLKWPPTPSEVFISLACIDRRTIVRKEEADEYTRAMIEDGNIDVILNEKKEIDFSDIGVGLPASNSSERVILVEGAPGVGKSTFAWEFCRRWERGEIARQYQLVLLLRLRDERMSIAKNLQQLICHPDIEDISQAIKCELIHNRGVNTLIILEGFDELSDSQRKEPSIFLQLILGQLLMHATIMITSRPWATGEIMRRIEHRIFQHIEVLGFTEENIVKYVRSVFTGEGKKTASAIDQSVGGPDEVSEGAKKNIDDVMAYLDTYPQIKACMYIPLNAAIVVSIYQDSKKGKCILPKTLTELYYALTQILLLRYLYGHADYKEQKWNIDCFEKDLPDKVYKQLLTICKVAYDGICRKGRKRVQLIFSDSDLGGCETLGFMQSVAEVYVKHGWNMSHNFLHLTVQEFLAAFLISTKSPAEQLKDFQRHKDGRLRVVLRFVAGLTKLNKVTPDELRSLLGEPTVEQSDEHQTPYCNPMRPDVCVSAHHTNWLFEAQNSELLQSLFHNHTVSFTFTRGMLPLEYYSVGYCIAHSHSKWSLTFDEDTEEEKVSMLSKGADTGDLQQCRIIAVRTKKSMLSENLNLLLTRFSGCVEELYLRVMTPLSLPHLSALRILELSLGGKSDVGDLSLPVLESLTVIGTTKNAINPNTKKSLCKLLSSSSSIVHFHFQSKVCDQSMEGIAQSVCDNTALDLKSLEIESDCVFNATATRSLAQFITRSTTLQYLKIHIDTFEDVDMFTKGLSDNIALPLKSLDIDCKCTFTTTATGSLIQFITRSTTLQSLKLNIDTLEDVDILAKGLSDNIALPLKSLDIDCKCTFTTTVTRSLVQFFTRSTTLQYIRICHVTFSAQELIELTETIHHCSRLQEKKLEELSFQVECSEDVVNLMHMIKEHPDLLKSITDWDGVTNIPSFLGQLDKKGKASLVRLGLGCSQDKSLSLRYMSVCDAGAVALAQALHYNSTLERLELSNNNISDAGAVALAQALHYNYALERLYLSNNNISDAGAVALAQALHHNSTLKKLYLSNSNINDAGAGALVQALHHNSTLESLNLSTNNISDGGAVALAHALHHNSTLKELIVYGNDAIGKEGSHQLVQALTVNTSLTKVTPYDGGLTLPRRCEEYATQCTQYNTVKDRIGFF